MDKFAEIALAYEAEQRAPGRALAYGDVPGTFDAITTQWLTAILCGATPGAQVSAFSMGDPDNGSSNRRRLFLEYNDFGHAAGLPATIFCKAAESLGSRVMLGAAGTSLAEVNFFNKVRSRLNIEAPEAYYAAFNPQTYAYIVVLKDIGDSVIFCDESTDITWPRAVSMVSLLASFHARFYASPELGTESLPYRTWPDFWNNMLKNSKGWAEACAHAMDISEHVVPPRLYKRRGQIWAATWNSVARHNALSKTLTHCDVHLKNWYLAPGNRMGLADWQILTVGHWSRDLIYALCTGLDIENRRAWLPELLRLYVDKMREFGVLDISFEEALLNCRQQLFTSLAFWTITLVPAPGMPPMQPEKTTYKFIERLTAAIDDMDALDSFE